MTEIPANDKNKCVANKVDNMTSADLIDRNSFLEYKKPLIISKEINESMPINKISYILSIPYYHIGIYKRSGKLILQSIELI